ncbi:hypothetical protein B0H11DRAFT_2093962 [Mycena galericulata]|nr:hypothetical protein B0H11DRAFT_2093962 [Mycena galericulata]
MELSQELFQFGGYYSSVEDFLENGDWNEMERLAYNPLADAARTTLYECEEPSVRTSGAGFPISADQPHRKRTLWDMARPKDSWKYEARVLGQRRRDSDAAVKQALIKWGSISDDQLPEPWSCNWARWGYVEEWFGLLPFELGRQADLRERYGVADLLPVMFFPYPQDRGPMVLSAEGIYYLYNHDMDDWLMRFDGTYASDQDFVENGDWNRMQLVEPSWPFQETDEDVCASDSMVDNSA